MIATESQRSEPSYLHMPGDISLSELGFELPDITLEELGFELPDITFEELGIKPPMADRRKPTKEERKKTESIKNHNIARKVGSGLLAVGALTGGYIATTVAQETFAKSGSQTTTTLPKENSVSASTRLETESTPTSAPEQLPYLEIKPRESFLTAEGKLAIPDYIFHADTVGSTIYGYMRPTDEGDKIGGELNSTPVDVVTPALAPQVMTPQLAEYAKNHPDFIPTLERGTVRGKKNYYWNGKSAGEYQKTSLQEYGYSVSPGQIGNSVHLMHASTRSVGGGDLPALKVGDELNLETTLDGNKYAYKLAEVEVLDVDHNGNLTQKEIAKQVAKGHREGVSAHEVIYRYIGHEDQATLTIQICGDEAGVPGGTNGKNAKEARLIYRFILDTDSSEIHKIYAGMPGIHKSI